MRATIPRNALRAFEAAAHHLSFTHTACFDANSTSASLCDRFRSTPVSAPTG
jgi:hypothetical protein